MSESTLVSALGVLTTLAIGYFFFYFAWQHYVIDTTRQQLFELRDQLFDMAADGKLDFNSDAYRILRKVFNVNIRFAHEADWIHILFFYIAASLLGTKGTIFKNAMQIPHLINQVEDDKVRAEVQKVFVKMHLIVTWHVYRRSLLLIPLVPLIVVLASLLALSIKVFIRAPRKIEALINARAYSVL